VNIFFQFTSAARMGRGPIICVLQRCGTPILRFEEDFAMISLVVVLGCSDFADSVVVMGRSDFADSVVVMGCSDFAGITSEGKADIILESVTVRSDRALDDARFLRLLEVMSDESEVGIAIESVIARSDRALDDTRGVRFLGVTSKDGIDIALESVIVPSGCDCGGDCDAHIQYIINVFSFI